MTKMLQTLETIDNIENKCVASFPKLMQRYPQTKFQLHFEKNEFFILHSYDQNHLTLLKFFNIYRLNKFQGMRGQKNRKIRANHTKIWPIISNIVLQETQHLTTVYPKDLFPVPLYSRLMAVRITAAELLAYN